MGRLPFNSTTYDDWRLPSTVDGSIVYGYEGDPDNDGDYNYTYGYNLANSEMGHLFYTELENYGYTATDGTSPQSGYGLANTGDFENLIGSWYTSSTQTSSFQDTGWHFNFSDGYQNVSGNWGSYYGLAVCSGDVAAPVPEPATLFLFASGLVGMFGLKKRKNQLGNL